MNGSKSDIDSNKNNGLVLHMSINNYDLHQFIREMQYQLSHTQKKSFISYS